LSKVRGVRFSTAEERLIEEFLKKNPLLDFSTLAKVSILAFVKNPHLELNAVGPRPKKESVNVRSN
jgi:hypothetical protein